MILSLLTNQARLEIVGGKGVNLAKLACAGYPVPNGFLITTQAYQTFVMENRLETQIQTLLTATKLDDPDMLQTISHDIRGRFSCGRMPSELSNAIRESYQSLGQPPVAVRSSATAEDLPEMSFAGQQDTFLNVVDEQTLLQAVVNCWSSLWTARAIGYRTHNGIPHDTVSLSVIVQEMIQAQASGVMFTAHPLTGIRTQTVIDATLGLGEALVGGLVEPDHYVIDTSKNRILSKTLGSKTVAIQGRAEGGVETINQNHVGQQALPDPQILQLAQLGQRVAAEYDAPQDIEWAWADEQLYLLQSRPITALYPLPEGMKPQEFKLFVSFGAVQGYLEPITPLGRDCLQSFFAGGAALFGLDLTYTTQTVLCTAGERLWINLTAVCQSTVGRRLLPHILPVVEPTFAQAIDQIWNDTRLTAKIRGVRLSSLPRFLGFALPFWRNVLRALLNPDRRRLAFQEQLEQRLNDLKTRSDTATGSPDRLVQRLALADALFQATPFLVQQGFTPVMAGVLSLVVLSRIARHLPNQDTESGRPNLALEINRGLPHNVTTEMDLCLWKAAQTIRSDPDSAQRFHQASATELAANYQAGQLPQPAQTAITQFLEQYGMRGVGEIDIGRPRWREQPAHILKMLQSYLLIQDENQAPHTVHQRGKQAAEKAGAQLTAAVRSTRGGRFKAPIVHWIIARFQALAGLRESPKFYVICIMGIIRQALLENGREWVEADVLTQPDDPFFLHLHELESLAHGEQRNWKALVKRRRQMYEREKMRVQIPRLLLSDGWADYQGLSDPDPESDVIQGSPVSPGVVEGVVRVVLEPHQAELKPGEILVCPGTDPAWTPLFLVAGGLVMEVGGMVTHGAIVAREYGLPAVVGVHQATQRLQTGQRVRVNGSTGQITLLE